MAVIYNENDGAVFLTNFDPDEKIFSACAILVSVYGTGYPAFLFMGYRQVTKPAA